MKFAEILKIFEKEVEPKFIEEKEYIDAHIIRFCFCAYMLTKYLNRKDEILDVGGIGIFAYLMRKLGYNKVTLLGKYDSERKERLRKLDIDFVACGNFDKDKINLTQKFTAITLFEVIEHVFDPMNLLLQLYDSVKYDGMIFCTTPNIASNHSISRLKKFETPYCYAFYHNQQPDICHKREFTPSEIARLMDASGFNLKYLNTFQSFNYLKAKGVRIRIKRWLLQYADYQFLEKKNLRGRTIFYVGIRGLRKNQTRFPKEFYAEYHVD